jgi:hypothetical protein
MSEDIFVYIFLFCRTVVNGILAQVASNLKTSCEVTDEAFSKRLDEVKEAKGKLENQKAETIVKIQEVTICFLELIPTFFF